MSLNKLTTRELILKQTRFKLHANVASFTVLLVIQLFALLFSFPTMTGSYVLDGVLLVEVSPIAHGVFTLFWAFFVGMSLALKGNWNEAFTFPTTRMTHHLSNGLVMLIFATIATIITTLIPSALRLLTQLRYKEVSVLTKTITEAPFDFVMQLMTTFLYISFVLIIGYTIRSIIYAHKGYGGVILIAFIALLLGTNFFLGISIIETLFSTFIYERSFLFFFLKIIITSFILFSLSIYTTNRLEVRDN